MTKAKGKRDSDTECFGCKYYMPFVDGSGETIIHTECRRFPPQVILLEYKIEMIRTHSQFPEAIAICGEFKKAAK